MKKKVIMLKTSTCTRCPMIEKMASKIAGIELVKLDAVNDLEGMRLAKQYNVKSVPVFIVGDTMIEGTIPALKQAVK